MGTSDIIALLALVVASGALSLEIRRWFAEGPKIHLSVMAEAIFIPNDDGKKKLVVTAVNRGDMPTTVTHMICVTYDNWWKQLRNKPKMQGVVNTQMTPLPYELAPNRSFMGMMIYDEETSAARIAGKLYTGVICSHSNKYFLIKVPGPKTNIPTSQIGSNPDVN